MTGATGTFSQSTPRTPLMMYSSRLPQQTADMKKRECTCYQRCGSETRGVGAVITRRAHVWGVQSQKGAQRGQRWCKQRPDRWNATMKAQENTLLLWALIRKDKDQSWFSQRMKLTARQGGTRKLVATGTKDNYSYIPDESFKHLCGRGRCGLLELSAAGLRPVSQTFHDYLFLWRTRFNYAKCLAN